MTEVNDLVKKANNAIARAQNAVDAEFKAIQLKLSADILSSLELDCSKLEARLFSTSSAVVRGRIRAELDKAVGRVKHFRGDIRISGVH